LDLKDVSESAAVTMFGRELQVVGAEQRKARRKKEVLWNGLDSRGAQSAATDARCDETAEVGRCCCAADLECQNG